jgi:hypothetical protein
MRRDCGIEKRLSKRLELRKGAFFVAAHQTAVPGDIRRQHSRQSPFNAFVRQNAPQGENSAQKYQSIRSGCSARARANYGGAKLLSDVRSGSFATGATQRQVQPCPL